jgi:hypothetical protein
MLSFSLLLLLPLLALASRDNHVDVSILKRNNNVDDDDMTSSSTLPQHTTLREADEGVVDGQCHNLGLHGEIKEIKMEKKKKKEKIILQKNSHNTRTGSYQQAKAVVSANLTALVQICASHFRHKYYSTIICTV